MSWFTRTATLSFRTVSLIPTSANHETLRMGNQISPTDTFEEVLERGRSQLSSTRNEYEALEETETVPSDLVEAISDLEQELDELDQTLAVNEADLKLAQQTVQRIVVLNEVFSALRERQRTVVEADVSRLEHHVSGIATLARERGLETGIERNIDSVERQCSMLNALVNKDRHEKVLTNDRVSPGEVDTATRQLDAELAEYAPSDSRAETYTTIAEKLLDEIHDALGSLGKKNKDRTAYSSDLGLVKQRLEETEEATGDDDGTAARIARTALEGALILHYSIARSHADQRVAEELANAVAESEFVVDCNIDRCVLRGDADTLLTAITAAIGTEVELSTGERLRQLLEEHDGSVLRTARATDFDVPTILDHLEQLYDDGQVADLRVTFER